MQLAAMVGALGYAAAGCVGSADDPNDGATNGSTTSGTPNTPQARGQALIDARAVNYGQALGTAAKRLVGRAPTLAEIKGVNDAADKKAAYEAQIAAYLAAPAFSTMIRDYFRNQLLIGPTPGQGGTNVLDTAPNFAAQLTVENRSYMELFTATTNTCPTFNGTAFTPASCNSGAPVTAGVLTDPNVMRHFASNFAFRRVKWVQERFACGKFPIEATRSIDVGTAGLKYTSAWEFLSIAGAGNGGRVDFHDASSVVCANCHATMNHQAPLFARFDMNGMWQNAIAVPTPLPGTPLALETDYLPPGQPYAWRLGTNVTDLAGFGQAMAADPTVAQCAVARVWNWAMGKGDPVDNLEPVPAEVIAPVVTSFQQSGFKLKAAIEDVFTSDDFVKF
jgi:hypothetical protein